MEAAHVTCIPRSFVSLHDPCVQDQLSTLISTPRVRIDILLYAFLFLRLSSLNHFYCLLFFTGYRLSKTGHQSHCKLLQWKKPRILKPLLQKKQKRTLGSSMLPTSKPGHALARRTTVLPLPRVGTPTIQCQSDQCPETVQSVPVTYCRFSIGPCKRKESSTSGPG